jgi:hypothetical protein
MNGTIISLASFPMHSRVVVSVFDLSPIPEKFAGISISAPHGPDC